MPRFDVLLTRDFPPTLVDLTGMSPPLEVTITMEARNELFAAIRAKARYPLYAIREVRSEALQAAAHPRSAGPMERPLMVTLGGTTWIVDPARRHARNAADPTRVVPLHGALSSRGPYTVFLDGKSWIVDVPARVLRRVEDPRQTVPLTPAPQATLAFGHAGPRRSPHGLQAAAHPAFAHSKAARQRVACPECGMPTDTDFEVVLDVGHNPRTRRVTFCTVCDWDDLV